MAIYTIVDGVRLRSSPEFAQDNVVRHLPEGTVFEAAEQQGDWWNVDGGCVHTTVVAELPDIARLSLGQPPYRSQWDTDADNRVKDCGQTCVAMLAEWHGIYVPVDNLTFQGDTSGVSTAQDLINSLHRIGLAARTIRLPFGEVPPLHTICFVSYGGFERAHVQDQKYRGWHWLVLLEIHDYGVVVHDPDFWDRRRNEGAFKQYGLEEWQRAFIPPDDGDNTVCVAALGPLP